MATRGETFLLEPSSDSVRAMQPREFRGLYGHKTPEGPLQELVAKHPEIIPGTEIGPGSVDPPRFVTLAVEFSNLDVLLGDQYAMPTIVETKMRENPESRRTVVGQVIEYAASAKSAWSAAVIQAAAASYWARQGNDVKEILQEAFGGEFDEETYWKDIQRNIEEGKIRILIVGDTIPPEARRSIEYLNKEMQNCEILGVEVGCYGSEESEDVVLVPRVIGQTQDLADKKTTGSRRKEPWTRDEFVAALDERDIGDYLKDLVRKFLEMAERLAAEKVVTIKWHRGVSGNFDLRCETTPLVAISGDGYANATMGSWKVSDADFELMRKELEKALGTELPSERNKWPGITKALLANDPELKGIEDWVRFAAQTVQKRK